MILMMSLPKKGTAMAGNYTPLEQYLDELPEQQGEGTPGVEQIERILNARLTAGWIGGVS